MSVGHAGRVRKKRKRTEKPEARTTEQHEKEKMKHKFVHNKSLELYFLFISIFRRMPRHVYL